MSFHKKTKTELKDIADELEVDISGISLKKAISDKIIAKLIEDYDFHVGNNTKYAKSAKYYRLGSPSKERPSSIGSNIPSTPTKPAAVTIEEEDDDDEDEEDEEADEDEDGEDDEEAAAGEEHSEDEIVLEGLTFAEKLDYWKESLLEKYYDVEDFIVDKNFDLREYLSDPSSLNKLLSIVELIRLASYYYETVPVRQACFVPQLLKDNLPAAVLNFSIVNLEVLASTQLWSTFFLGAFVSYLLPSITGYYIGFDYSEVDPFIFSLSKLFYCYTLFKSVFTSADIQQEVKFAFSSGSFSLGYISDFVHHSLFHSTFVLRGLFANWHLTLCIFTTLVALYAQVMLEGFEDDSDDEDDYDYDDDSDFDY